MRSYSSSFEIGTPQFGNHMLPVQNQGRDLNRELKLSIASGFRWIWIGLKKKPSISSSIPSLKSRWNGLKSHLYVLAYAFLPSRFFNFAPCSWGFPGGSVLKRPLDSAEDARDSGLIPGLRRSPGGGDGNPLRYSCLKNFMDRGSWWATVHRVTKSQTWLKQLSMPTHTVKDIKYRREWKTGHRVRRSQKEIRW